MLQENWTEWDYLFELAESESAADRLTALVKARTFLNDSKLSGAQQGALLDAIEQRNRTVHELAYWPTVSITISAVRAFYEKWLTGIDKSYIDTRPIDVEQIDSFDELIDEYEKELADMEYQDYQDEEDLRIIMEKWQQYNPPFDEFLSSDKFKQMIIWAFGEVKKLAVEKIKKNPNPKYDPELDFTSGPATAELDDILRECDRENYDTLTVNIIEDTAFKSEGANYRLDIKTTEWILESLFIIREYFRREDFLDFLRAANTPASP